MLAALVVLIVIMYLIFAFAATFAMTDKQISQFSFGRRVVKKTEGDDVWYELQQMTPFFYWVKIKPFYSRARVDGKFLSEAEPKKYLDEYNQKVAKKKTSKTEVIK